MFQERPAATRPFAELSTITQASSPNSVSHKYFELTYLYSHVALPVVAKAPGLNIPLNRLYRTARGIEQKMFSQIIASFEFIVVKKGLPKRHRVTAISLAPTSEHTPRI